MHELRLSFPMNAKQRIESLMDEQSFEEFNQGMLSENPLGFPGYLEKLEKDREKTSLNEAVVTGKGTMADTRLLSPSWTLHSEWAAWVQSSVKNHACD